MARSPKQKAIDNPRMLGGMDILYNNIIPYDVPRYTDGNLWRYVAGKQPIVMLCIASMTMYAQSLPWDIRAKDVKDKDKLKDKIKYYKQVFEDAGGFGRLNHLDFLIQDYYTVPFGGASEKVDYSDGKLYKMVNIDAATLYPTNNPTFPVMQKVGIREPILFGSNEVVRMYQTPRTEIARAGWGMTPTEKVYLAVELLSRGDKYYAQLLLDTPEAGILDLGDMSKESAENWLESYKTLLAGIDAFKIPVLYQHTVQAKFIPFGRPPTDILFNDTTFKYASIVCGAFGMSVGDIGLKHVGGGNALSSQMRDERHSKSTGYASLKSHLTQYYNAFMPDDMEFIFIDTDDELLVAKGRARSANAIGFRNLVEAGIITPDESRAQLVEDGLMTIPLADKPKDSEFDILNRVSGLDKQIDIQQQQVDIQTEQLGLQKKQANAAMKAAAQPPTVAVPNKSGGQGGTGLNKQRAVRGGKVEAVQGKEPVPPSQGGVGEIKKSEAASQNELESLLQKEFDGVKTNMTAVRSRKLVKVALKKSYTTLKSATDREDYDTWHDEYVQMIFGIGENAVIKSYVSDQLSAFSESIGNDKWWNINFNAATIAAVLGDFYALGLQDAADEIQAALYEEGYADDPNVQTSFNITDETLLKELNNYADKLANTINNGTEYFIQRLSLASIIEASSDPYYRQMIKDGTSLEKLLENDQFIDYAANIFDSNLKSVLDERIKSIATVENQKSYNNGLLKQYKSVGIKTKALVHIGDDEPCEDCKIEEALGFVAIDYKFKSKFGGESEIPPLHPNCHHVLTFSKSDMKNINMNYYNGSK